jgi:prevent-host-death family protein
MRYGAAVPAIPQRELRNNVGEVLRRAERGERFTITVNGRPVAELGPIEPNVERRGTRPLRDALADAPVDAGWTGDLDELREADRQDANDPWHD